MSQPLLPQFDHARLDAIMTERLTSARRLAEILGVSSTTVDRYRKGTNCPMADVLAELARWSGVSMDDWMKLPAANMLHPAPDCDTVGEQ